MAKGRPKKQPEDLKVRTWQARPNGIPARTVDGDDWPFQQQNVVMYVTAEGGVRLQFVNEVMSRSAFGLNMHASGDPREDTYKNSDYRFTRELIEDDGERKFSSVRRDILKHGQSLQFLPEAAMYRRRAELGLIDYDKYDATIPKIDRDLIDQCWPIGPGLIRLRPTDGGD